MSVVPAPNTANPWLDPDLRLLQQTRTWVNAITMLQPLDGSGSPDGVEEAMAFRFYIDTDTPGGLWVKTQNDVGGDKTLGWVSLTNPLVTTVTADYVIPDNSDRIIICTNTSAITVTMPTLVSNNKITVQRSGAAVTVDGDGATIIGSATQAIGVYGSMQMFGTAAEWVVL